MKQKNMILIAVAVGCGLVAAFLMTQMNAKQKASENLVQVPVAVKAMSVNFQLSKDKIKDLIEYKTFNADSLPPKTIMTVEELADKRIKRAMRPGEAFNADDISDKATVDLPPGHDMVTFPVSQDELVGGWAVPGVRVDVVATIRKVEKGRYVVFPLFRDILVVAVGTVGAAEGTFVQGVSNVSLAMTKKQSEVLNAALGRSAKLRFTLRNQGEAPEKIDPKDDYRWKPTPDQILAAFASDVFGPDDEDSADNDKEPEFKAVKMPVPKEKLPAGTRLTADVIKTKFTVMQILPPAPDGMITNLMDYQGDYLVKDLEANQYVPPSYLAAEMPKPEPMAVAAPEPPPVAADPEHVPVYHDVIIMTATGRKVMRYEVVEVNGVKTYKFLGEVRTDADAPGDRPGKSGGPTGPRI